jgi:EAL domain-containing protein (putative c-di-GMP-specific phosphodiesterase class I)/GGDEF domain-containing protein
MNHDYFVNIMTADLNRGEYNEGVLVIFRLSNLAQLDEALGYPRANALLKKIGNVLESHCKEDSSIISGRLSGTEFAVFCRQSTDEFALANKLKDAVTKAAETNKTELTARFLVVTTKTGKMVEANSLFKALQLTLNISSSSEENYLRVINASNIVVTENDYLVEWKSSLSDALSNKRIKLEHFPVISSEGTLIHNESPVRLQLEENGKWYCAGEFINWAIQLNLITAVDELVLETAIGILSQGGQPLCLNVSAYSMCDPKYAKKAATLIQQHLQHPEHLSFEVPEVAVFEHLNEFKQFCSVLKTAGCHVGIEHVGQRISRLGELHDIGISYIKFDASIVRNIDTLENNKSLLRGLCMVVHSIGVQAIAEGVNSKGEIKALKEIGIDGLTGPAIRLN